MGADSINGLDCYSWAAEKQVMRIPFGIIWKDDVFGLLTLNYGTS
jgi:hypothetical protein